MSVGSYKDAELTVTEPVLPTEWCKTGDLARWQTLSQTQTVSPSTAVEPRPPTPQQPLEPVPVTARVVQPAPSSALKSQPSPQTPTATAPETALDPTMQQLETAYSAYQERVRLVYEIMGNPNPTVQQIDTAIVACIQQTVPAAKQGDVLRCLQRSPKVIQLKAIGYEAAAAYVNQVLAPTLTAQPKTKTVGLEYS